jgi:hypothetical protein
VSKQASAANVSLLPAEEQVRLIRTEGGEADKRRSFKAARLGPQQGPLAEGGEQRLIRRRGAVPRRRLEQPEERR